MVWFGIPCMAISSVPVQEGEHELLEEPVEERQEVSFRNQLLFSTTAD